jgi:hypothetical protein
VSRESYGKRLAEPSIAGVRKLATTERQEFWSLLFFSDF